MSTSSCIVNVKTPSAQYPIHIGSKLLTNGALLAQYMPTARAVIISNETVAPLYLAPLQKALEHVGVQVETLILPDGEAYKNWQTLNLIFDGLLAQKCERKTTLLALGGGVIGDMVGFAAAVYQRGVPFIQVPTTLLAQVDSSVGGKTAINHPLGKNMIGAFYQPRLVLMDIDTLQSLPDRELSAGLAEVIKYGLINDPEFFAWLEAHIEQLVGKDPKALAYAIECSCNNKAQVVAADEKEEGLRALLNLGHTFGHAIEAGLGFGQWLHGEAVAAGMVMAAEASCLLGHLSKTDVQRVRSLLQQAGLPTVAPELGEARYLELMAQDKKVEDGQIRFILMRSIGDAYIDHLSQDLAAAAIRAGCAQVA